MSDPIATYEVDPLTAWLMDLDPPMVAIRSFMDARQVFVNRYPIDQFWEECHAHTDLAKWYLTTPRIADGPPEALGLVPLPPLDDGNIDVLESGLRRVTPTAPKIVAVDPDTVYPGNEFSFDFPNGQPQSFPVPEP